MKKHKTLSKRSNRNSVIDVSFGQGFANESFFMQFSKFNAYAFCVQNVINIFMKYSLSCKVSKKTIETVSNYANHKMNHNLCRLDTRITKTQMNQLFCNFPDF